MPIEVETPDGGIAEFPDGTAPEQIERALQERFSAPLTPAASHAPTSSPDPLASHSPYRGLSEDQEFQLSVSRNLRDHIVGAGQSVMSTIKGMTPDPEGPPSIFESVTGINPEPPGLYEPANEAQVLGKGITHAAQFFAPTPDRLLKQGKAARIIAEMAKGGGITAAHGGSLEDSAKAAGYAGVGAGVGEVVSLAAPHLRQFAVRSILRALGVNRKTEPAVEEIAANVLSGVPDEAAGSLSTKDVLPTADNVEPIAQEVLESGIGIGTRRILQQRTAARRAAAGQAVERLQGGATPVSIEPVASHMEDLAGKETWTLPGGEEVLPEQPPRMADGETWQRYMAALARAKPGEVKPPVTIAGDPDLGSQLSSRAREMREIADAFPEGAPSGALFRLREQLGRAARRGGYYERTAGNPGAAEAESRATTQAALSEALHEAIPESRVADEAYKTWVRADNALRNALRGQLSATSMDRFSAAALGRLIGTNFLAAGVGGAGAHAAGRDWQSGAIGAAVIYNLSRSAFWNSLSAQTKLRLAQAIESGADDVALNLLTSATLAYSDSTRIPVTARAKRELERIQSLPDSAVE
jgi:hypothetical protein